MVGVVSINTKYEPFKIFDKPKAAIWWIYFHMDAQRIFTHSLYWFYGLQLFFVQFHCSVRHRETFNVDIYKVFANSIHLIAQDHTLQICLRGLQDSIVFKPSLAAPKYSGFLWSGLFILVVVQTNTGLSSRMPLFVSHVTQKSLLIYGFINLIPVNWKYSRSLPAPSSCPILSKHCSDEHIYSVNICTTHCIVNSHPITWTNDNTTKVLLSSGWIKKRNYAKCEIYTSL